MRGSVGEDRGETLIELIMAIAILSIAGVAIMASLEFAIKSSDLGRKQATGGSYARSAAEAIQSSVASGGYTTCAGANAYLTSAVTSAVALPSGYTVTQAAATVWNGSAWAACTSSTDKGIQRLDLTVTSPSTSLGSASEKLTVMVRKPCSGALPSPC